MTSTAAPEPPVALLPASGEALFCPALEGIDRCPECGLAIDRQGFARSQIPWVHRRHVGRVRAYWRTLWLATLHPGRIAMEAARRVDYSDAQRFRWVTAFIAAAPVIAGLIGAMAWYGNAAIFSLIPPSAIGGWMMTGAASVGFDFFIPWDSGATLPPVIPLAVVIICILVTGVASYWFHPKALPIVRQNRAVALSYYACGPLALASVPVLLFIGVAVMREAGLDDQANAAWAVVRVLEIAGVLTALAVIGATWRATLTLLSRTTHAGFGKLMLAGVLIPLKWLLCVVGVLVALPWVVGFVRLVIGSLR